VTAVTETQESRHVLVTGGNRGIGRAIAERFLQAGYKVTCADLGGEPPEGAFGVWCNVTDAEQVDAAFKAAEAENGPVGVLVANAGITKDTLILRMGDAEWDAVIDVNLKGAFRTAKRAVRSMLRQKWGRIVFIGSVVGMYGSPGQVNYSATKAGVIGMARSLTREVGARGVTANVVAPGFIKTEMTAVLPEDVVANYERQIPAGHLGEVADIANAVFFLSSEEAGYISGAVIPVDGGLGMGH
jgi:3-oxoacyl-[acyl-carrier protein] reductase